MNKTKMKLWKKILIVLLILLCVSSAIIVRRMIILSNLDKKVTNYENNYNNIHITLTYEFADYKTNGERFIKDEVDKMIIENTNANGSKTRIIQITYPEERKLYTDRDGIKVLNIYKEKAPIRGTHIEKNMVAPSVTTTTIANYAYSMNFLERILNAIVTDIKTVEIDGRKCYELSSLNNTNFVYQEGLIKMSAYIDKETGLAVKVIQKSKENDMIKENVTTYKYEFNNVTDEDMKEPDSSEYEIRDNR